MIEVLKKSIRRIKKNLEEEKDEKIKLGIYMALTSLKNDLTIENEDMVKVIGLNEELEKYL